MLEYLRRNGQYLGLNSGTFVGFIWCWATFVLGQYLGLNSGTFVGFIWCWATFVLGSVVVGDFCTWVICGEDPDPIAPAHSVRVSNHLSMATSSPKSVTETQSSTTTSERRDVLGHIVEERPGCDDCLSYVYLGRCGLWPQCPHHHPQELKLEEQRKKLKRSRKPRFTSRPVFTPEQKRAHFERVKETNGFDVGDVPLGSRVDGMLFPLPLSHCGRDHDNLAKLAIECYNEEHGTKYKFVKLVRVITSAVGGVMYYITFQAKDEKPGSRSQNFQTRVYAAAAKGKIEVKLCRLEQKKSTRRF